MENNGRSKRTLLSTLVEPFKQIKLGFYVLGISLIFSVLSGVLFVSAFVDQYHHVMSIFNVVDPKLQWDLVLNDVFMSNAAKLALLLVTFMVVLFAVVFRITHRYYGPLVSIERFVEQIAAGQYASRVTIRNKDELQRLCGKLNGMAAELESRHGAAASHKGGQHRAS